MATRPSIVIQPSDRGSRDMPEAVKAMEGMGAPTSQPCRGSSCEFKQSERLVLTQVTDCLPGVAAYDSTSAVDFLPATDGRARMVVTLSQMHDAAATAMQKEGFTSQLSKLDRRYEGTARVGGEASD